MKDKITIALPESVHTEFEKLRNESMHSISAKLTQLIEQHIAHPPEYEKEPLKKITGYLPPETYIKLREYCKTNGITRTRFMRDIINLYVNGKV